MTKSQILWLLGLEITGLHSNLTESNGPQILGTANVSFLLFSPFIHININVTDGWFWITVSGKEQNIHQCSVATFCTPVSYIRLLVFRALARVLSSVVSWCSLHPLYEVNSSTGGCLWEAPHNFVAKKFSTSSLWLPPHPDSKENKQAWPHLSDYAPASCLPRGAVTAQRLHVCGAGPMCVVFLSFYNIWIWMIWGGACSLVHSKSHYVLFDSHIYITCRGSCHGRQNHRRK